MTSDSSRFLRSFVLSLWFLGNLAAVAAAFRVKGSNNDGLWNERGASIKLRILPFFWQTWRFRLALIVLALAALVAIHRLRVSRLLQIERLRTRIAGDLHDDLSSELSGIALAPLETIWLREMRVRTWHSSRSGSGFHPPRW